MELRILISIFGSFHDNKSVECLNLMKIIDFLKVYHSHWLIHLDKMICLY